MTFFSLKRVLQYFLPGTLTLFMLVTIERNVQTDGAYEKLYGMPFSFISNGYAFTHHFDVYIFMMLLDLLCYFIASILIFKLIDHFGIRLKAHKAFVLAGILITIFWIFSFYALTFESTFKFKNDFDFQT